MHFKRNISITSQVENLYCFLEIRGKRKHHFKPLLALVVKYPPASAEDTRDAGSIPRWEVNLEKRVATYSSILAWKIPWMEEPGRLQCVGCKEGNRTE